VISYASPVGRWVLAATILGSAMVFIDGTVVNVALPTIGRDLGLDFVGLQWTVNAYSLTLSSLLLLGGSLGDRFGRRRVFVIGVVWFAIASLLSGVAPQGSFLIVARALQGVGGALLTPGSLAIIEASFVPEDRSTAVGAWSGLGGVATAIGPVLGGYLVQAVSWRLAFLINLPIAALVVWIGIRHVPESRNPNAARHVDVPGAALCTIGLALLVYALMEGPGSGWPPVDVVTLLAGVAALAAFVLVELRSPGPMLPMRIFRIQQFSVVNVVTFIIYGALGGALFLLPIQLQRVVGLTPVEAGASLLPVTVLLLLLSARAGRLAQRIGPRLPMTVGPIVVGAGFLLMVRVGPGSSYVLDVLPAVLVLALGLALTVAPLTATALAAAGEENAGMASAVNNDVARTAGLMAVALLPVVVGITPETYAHPDAFSAAFHRAVVVTAGLCVLGGLLSLAGIRNPNQPVADTPNQCPISGPQLRCNPATAESPSA
jgi:EmrB/QacA subfamily drug resistance transporter